MIVGVEHYGAILTEGPFDTEGLTILVVADATSDEVATGLGIDTAVDPVEYVEYSDEDSGTDPGYYWMADMIGGVVAIEASGYADPSLDSLRRLTSGGRSAAVVRSNIQAHLRFGCARDGEIVFDADEYMYVEAEQKDAVPVDLRELFDSEWYDLEAGGEDDEVEDEDIGFDRPFAVGLAMVEVFTGLHLTVEDLHRAYEGGLRPAPCLVYRRSEG